MCRCYNYYKQGPYLAKNTAPYRNSLLIGTKRLELFVARLNLLSFYAPLFE